MASNSYFDLQTIVAEEERVPVRFNTDALKIGYLDPSNDSEVWLVLDVAVIVFRLLIFSPFVFETLL